MTLPLPSRYISSSGLRNYYGYIDTGVVPSSTTEIDILFDGLDYIFGARNSNSNSSQGQMNLNRQGAGSNSYVGFNATRVNMGDLGISGIKHLHIGGGEAIFNNHNYTMIIKSVSTGTFIGNRNMYLFGLNNAGAVSRANYGSLIQGVRIRVDGVLERDFAPVYDTTTSKYGMYDVVHDVFYPDAIGNNNDFYSQYLVTTDHSDGGDAVIRTLNAGYVKKQYGGTTYTSNINLIYETVKLVAIPTTGYSFSKWVDTNDNVISLEKEFEYLPTADITLKAIFVRNTDIELNTGYKVLGLKYGQTSRTFQDDFYANILNASVNIDLLQKSTTSIEVENVPSVYQVNMPIFIISPKGRVVYGGIITAIDGNKITAREPLSLFDEDFLAHSFANVKSVSSIDYTLYTYIGQIYSYLSQYRRPSDYVLGGLTDATRARKYAGISFSINSTLALDSADNLNIGAQDPAATTMINLEEMAYSAFNNYGIVFKPHLLTMPTYHSMQMSIDYYKSYPKITIGSNNEEITNVSVVNEDMETTIMYIFNSSGTTLRGIYAVNNDGNIVNFDGSTGANDLIAYNKYKLKLVQSDDNIRVICAENLSSALFNHKISFDMDLTGNFYRYDDIVVGSQCDFFYKNNLYKSIVTGISYTIERNKDQINKGSVTLGKVRNSLTSKINLKKVK